MMRNKYMLFGGLFILALVGGILFFYFIPDFNRTPDYPYYGHMVGGWMMPFMMIFMGLFWLCVIYLILKAIDHKEQKYSVMTIDILKKRLVKGEITVEEYENLLKKVREGNI